MPTKVVPDAGVDTRTFSIGGVLRAALRAWWRNVWSLTAIMVVVTLPGLALDLAWPGEPHAPAARMVVGLFVGVASGMVMAAALGAAGLESVRGRRPRVVPTLLRGVALAWRMLMVSIRAFRWGTGAGLVLLSMILLQKAGTLEQTGTTLLGASAMLVALLVLLVSVPVTWARVFPLPAVLQEEPERTNSELVRRARELTHGRWWRVSSLFLVGVLCSALALVADLPNLRSGGMTHPVAHIVVMLVDAFAWGFVQILPSVAYVHLSGEREVNELAQVFG